MPFSTSYLRLIPFAFWGTTFTICPAASAHAPQPPITAATVATKQTGLVTARHFPSLPLPILERVRALQRAARTGKEGAAPEARASYREAENAFGRLLASAGALQKEETAPQSADGGVSAPGTAPDTAQSASDIRALKSFAKRAPFGEAAFWNRAAELYATGARLFVTAQLRDALFAPAGRGDTAEGSGPPTVILDADAGG